MTILNGWKEIADCLNRTPRSAQRWERLGLPVRRLSRGSRAPVIAFRQEIENWVRSQGATHGDLEISINSMKQTRFETRRLVNELRAVRKEHARLLGMLRSNMEQSRSARRLH